MSTRSINRALFLFPTDVMGGAENVTRMVAEATLNCGDFDEVICFVLSGERHGTLDYLEKEFGHARLIYTGARNEQRGVFKLFRLLSKHSYDLVFSSHTHTNAAASLMRRIGLLKTQRLVTRESTMIFERDLGLRGHIIRSLYWLYGAQDLIICQTQRMQQSLSANTRNRFANMTRTLPNPVDIDAIGKAVDSGEGEFEPPSNQRLIAWCGRLSEVKSPLRAVDVLAELHSRGMTDIHLVMMGDGPLYNKIKDHAASQRVTDHITLTGRVSKPATIMKHCELGLMTSDTEGFPNVILEMLASGIRAVVTTDCAGGLKGIPGVHVSAEKTARSLAGDLAAQLKQRESDPSIAGYLENRSPRRFLQELLQS